MDTPSTSEDKTTADTTSSSDNTFLANPVLVSNLVEDEAQITTSQLQDQQMDDDRMVIIRGKRKFTTSLDEQTLEFFTLAHRSATHRIYNNNWKKWIQWCKEENQLQPPTDYDALRVLRFLMANKTYSYQYLNGLRSAIASVYKTLHPDKTPLAEQDCIIDFFKSKRKSEVTVPKQHQLQTWDTSKVVEYIQGEWPKGKEISIYDLQLKTITLLCLSTMARPRSDIERLQYRDIHFEFEDKQPISVMIHF